MGGGGSQNENKGVTTGGGEYILWVQPKDINISSVADRVDIIPPATLTPFLRRLMRLPTTNLFYLYTRSIYLYITHL